MPHYAEETKVSADKSRAEIDRILQRYGADQFMYGWSGAEAVVAFKAHGRAIQFKLKMPDRNSREFTHTSSRNIRRDESAAEKAWEQACRQRWRALALVIKAKLEAVESGISTFEDEFLAWTLLPGGVTVSAMVQPKITEAYETGQMPVALIPYFEKEHSQ